LNEIIKKQKLEKPGFHVLAAKQPAQLLQESRCRNVGRTFQGSSPRTFSEFFDKLIKCLKINKNSMSGHKSVCTESSHGLPSPVSQSMLDPIWGVTECIRASGTRGQRCVELLRIDFLSFRHQLLNRFIFFNFYVLFLTNALDNFHWKGNQYIDPQDKVLGKILNRFFKYCTQSDYLFIFLYF